MPTVIEMDKNTPLYVAVMENDIELVKEIGKEDLFSKNYYDDTPLHIAIKHDQQEIVDYLSEGTNFDDFERNVGGESIKEMLIETL